MTETPKTQIKIDTLEKNYDRITQLVGDTSYVDWDGFTKNSSGVVKSIDELNRVLTIFRESQHRNFIQTMKKLKSLDVPDLVKTVKSKKLPKQALRGILTRFKLVEQQLELVETPEKLKQNAIKQFEAYIAQNSIFVEHITKFTQFLNESIKNSGYQAQKVPQVRQIKATVKFNLSEEKAQALAGNVQIQYLPQTHQLIGLKTYTQIVDASYDLIKSQYEKLTFQARKKQRDVVSDHQKYLEVMNEYLLNSEALIIEAQTMIAHKVGVVNKQLQQSEIALMERGLANNVLMIQSQLRAKIKQSLSPSKDVSLQVAKEVIDFQTKMINQKSDYIKSVFSSLEKSQQSNQIIPMLLALILNDMVFEKYGYEEEDFMKNVGEQAISTNPDLTQLFRDMEVAIIKLMQKLQVIPEDLGKMMEQSATQRGLPNQGMQQGLMQPGMMPQGMLPPGMMPGSNPMDLLQMQQMQQMQQMFGQMGLQLPK